MNLSDTPHTPPDQPHFEWVFLALQRIFAAVNAADNRHGKPRRQAVRAKAACEIVGLGRSNFFARQNPKDSAWDPTFPRSFKLGATPHSPTVWFVDELEAWLEQRAALRSR
ncbi:helix-turn-helix transcriptional regulator [Dyella caseinilytica]|uniref:AlpA family phage regulatory protein n=1 Tax=Dyella caseinilytica TaxID=1849581 RepID=A0ABX7GP69_9GAMM|nr:AlpA family phage regulatory protein [Dyella caseinilytica]QRN52225.1 AlpA family phage regulatory protein [Dyella caseinilytica]GGA14196.1 hypothetical protein GCM10011408_39880 [Dyella caseinilytica]